MADNFFDEEDIVEESSSFFDEADVVEEPKSSIVQEMENEEAGKMGAGEAALTGFGEGASMGLAPIVSGAVAAGGEVIEDIGDVLGLTTDSELRDQGFDIKDQEEGLSGLMKAYYEGRQGQKKQQEKAFEDQTAASLAGNIAGGITSLSGVGALAGGLSKGGKAAQLAAKALPKAESLKGLSTARKAGIASREGLKAGGLAGFGSGDAKLLDEDQSILEGAADIAQETAQTAIGGAALGGLASGAMSGAGKISSFIPGVKSASVGREIGKEGLELTEESLGGATEDLAKSIRSKIGKIFKSQGLRKADALEYADEIGIRVNAGEEISEVVDDIVMKGATSIEDQAEKVKFVKSMQAIKGEITPEIEAMKNLDVKQAKQAIRLKEKGFEPVASGDELVPTKKGDLMVSRDTYVGPKDKEITKIADQLVKDPEVALKQFDLENISLSELDQVINEVNRHTGDLTGPAQSEAQKRSRILAGRLRELSNEAIEGSGDLAESNLKLSRAFSALKRGGVKGNVMSQSKMQADTQVDALKSMLSKESDASSGRQRFFEYLDEAQPGGFEGDKAKSELLRKGKTLQKLEDTESGGLLYAARRFAGEAGRLEGAVENKITQAPKKIAEFAQKKLYGMDSDGINKLSEDFIAKHGDKAQSFAGPLQKAANSEGRTRTAIMYGLYQQPAFRKMLNAIGESVIGEDEIDE